MLKCRTLEEYQFPVVGSMFTLDEHVFVWYAQELYHLGSHVTIHYTQCQ